VPIDYDPGASDVNQLNRIKLMMAAAHRNLEKSRTEQSDGRNAGVSESFPVERTIQARAKERVTRQKDKRVKFVLQIRLRLAPLPARI
jgi:hypothetical protein